MCRNIRTLFNFDPPASEQEIREASLQFVRKLSGFAVPSKANEAAFQRAVTEVAVGDAVRSRACRLNRRLDSRAATERSRGQRCRQRFDRDRWASHGR